MGGVDVGEGEGVAGAVADVADFFAVGAAGAGLDVGVSRELAGFGFVVCKGWVRYGASDDVGEAEGDGAVG